VWYQGHFQAVGLHQVLGAQARQVFRHGVRLLAQEEPVEEGRGAFDDGEEDRRVAPALQRNGRVTHAPPALRLGQVRLPPGNVYKSKKKCDYNKNRLISYYFKQKMKLTPNVRLIPFVLYYYYYYSYKCKLI
jgi:hypothetical protein